MQCKNGVTSILFFNQDKNQTKMDFKKNKNLIIGIAVVSALVVTGAVFYYKKNGKASFLNDSGSNGYSIVANLTTDGSNQPFYIIMKNGQTVSMGSMSDNTITDDNGWTVSVVPAGGGLSFISATSPDGSAKVMSSNKIRVQSV